MHDSACLAGLVLIQQFFRIMTESLYWLGRCARSAAFGIAALILLTIARIVFFFVYKNDDLSFVSDFMPAMVMGLRVDAKWLAIMLLPAWACVLLSYWKAFFWRLARVLAGVGMFVVALLTVINFGFYGFYGTPISPIIFGFIQDDTKAIVVTILKDWPVFSYLACLAGLVIVPFAFAFLAGRGRERRVGKAAYAGLSLLSIVMLVLIIRGSLGTFPLRIQSYSVSKNAFVNASVPNGMAAFHEARKGMEVLELKGGAAVALRQQGFASISEAEALISAVRPSLPASEPLKSQPHVVLAIMESMGRDVFESNKPGVNDTLGALANELDDALVFKQSLCVGRATFPTIEGLLFDSPLDPITQSRYGRHPFDFSRMFEYKKAGYKTIFLTAGPEAWRQIETNFPQQGFDEIIGAGKLSALYPEAEVGTWGIGDAWMFKRAEEILKEADEKGEKLFIVMLSTANHPPHRVPDSVKVNPVSYKALPSFITDTRYDILTGSLQTYQYAANALGGFVHDMKGNALKRELMIVATGDHNLRISYAGGYSHHLHGVPVMFWVPESLKAAAAKVDVTRWAGHRDIFPTIAGVVLGKTPEIHEGRNLFAGETMDLIVSYTGLAAGSWGAATFDGNGVMTCYRWENDRMVSEDACTGLSKKMADAARAQWALADYKVRKGLLNEK